MKVGILGAGQLGRMMALAGYPLGIDCIFLGGGKDSPAGQVSRIFAGALDDNAQLDALAAESDVVTFEFENVPVESLKRAAAGAPVHPSVDALAAGQDRLEEKRLLRSAGIPTAPYVAVSEAADLLRAEAELGWPQVLKARRMGYDGKSQRIVHSTAELAAAWSELNQVPSIAEGWVRFDRELSLIGVRGAEGQTAFYPLSENVHSQGILSTSVAPYEDPHLQLAAEAWLKTLMDRFDYRGVLTVEFFHTDAGLVANEIAPRVHNSGHWTIEGAETSQFENHLRGVLGLPLGSTATRGHAAMLNLIGQMPDRNAMLRIPGAHLHDYAKAPRPGRKLGHCTILRPTRHEAEAALETLRAAEGHLGHLDTSMAESEELGRRLAD